MPARLDFAQAFFALEDQIACPACYKLLRLEADRLICTGCGRRYPVVDGIPVLIAEAGAVGSDH